MSRRRPAAMQRKLANMADPVEKLIVEALLKKGLPFVRDGQGETFGLDFYLPSLGVFIECKQFHTERTTEQMKRVSNIIVIQGVGAAAAFAAMLSA